MSWISYLSVLQGSYLVCEVGLPIKLKLTVPLQRQALLQVSLELIFKENRANEVEAYGMESTLIQLLLYSKLKGRDVLFANFF